MKRILLILILLFLFSVILTGQEQPVDKATLIARAAAKYAACTREVVNVNFDKNGKKKKGDRDKQDGVVAKKLTIPLIFRPGRYDLKPLSANVLPNGHVEAAYRFSPLAETLRLKDDPRDDLFDKGISRILNELAGVVRIDTTTETLTYFKFEEPKEPVEVWKVFGIKKLDITFEHGLMGYDIQYWKRSKWLFFTREEGDVGTVRFICRAP